MPPQLWRGEVGIPRARPAALCSGALVTGEREAVGVGGQPAVLPLRHAGVCTSPALQSLEVRDCLSYTAALNRGWCPAVSPPHSGDQTMAEVLSTVYTVLGVEGINGP